MCLHRGGGDELICGAANDGAARCEELPELGVQQGREIGVELRDLSRGDLICSRVRVSGACVVATNAPMRKSTARMLADMTRSQRSFASVSPTAFTSP